MENALKLKENGGILGIHTITLYDMTSKAAQDLEREILEILKRPGGNMVEYKKAVELLKSKFAVHQEVKKNLVVLQGRAAIADRLASRNTYSGNINYGAVGTSSVAPASADTQLGAEVYRKLYSSQDISTLDTNGQFTLSFFYAAGDFTNSNVNEFGTFVDGSASANSGRLFSHVKFASAINKTSTKSLTVDAQYSITSA